MNGLPDGYKVVWKHWRVADSWWWNNKNARLYIGHPRLVRYGQPHHSFIPAPRGGYTECFIYNENREMVAHDYALCSFKDQFVYKIGRQISFGRALKQLQAPLTTHTHFLDHVDGDRADAVWEREHDA